MANSFYFKDAKKYVSFKPGGLEIVTESGSIWTVNPSQLYKYNSIKSVNVLPGKGLFSLTQMVIIEMPDGTIQSEMFNFDAEEIRKLFLQYS